MGFRDSVRHWILQRVADDVFEKPSNWIELIYKSYLRHLRKQPLETKAITSGVIFAISDVIAQNLGQQDYSLKRNILAALWGAIWAGPSAHYWQRFMHEFIRGHDFKSVALKVVLDQLTYGPINNALNIGFFSLLSDGMDFRDVVDHVQDEFPRVQLNAWKLWPAVAFISFRYIPEEFRVLFLNIVALGWVTFLNTFTTYRTGYERYDKWD